MEKIEILPSRERDLGGFSVHRVLPESVHKMVGPFIFFDHMGPANFTAGNGMDVRPHPHINLATVTYLFEGKICHRDSLGSVQLIEPGAINWMIAGQGIVHSERTPEDIRRTGSRLNGIQCWVALPEEHEEIKPSFTHYPASILPKFMMGEVELTLLLGNAFQKQSPVNVLSNLFYLHAKLPKGSKLVVPSEGRESGAYVAKGNVIINDQPFHQYSMAVCHHGEKFNIRALEDSELMLLGGKSVGERYIYWNFVSSSKDKIKQAKLAWSNGPGEASSRFPKIPTDDQEFIPLPEETKDKKPSGTIM
ncbi:MAG: pirin family protein [Coxiellaceae bacterium]|nr:MAG: pirin family protein [Coxiellaceae bacterium]